MRPQYLQHIVKIPAVRCALTICDQRQRGVRVPECLALGARKVLFPSNCQGYFDMTTATDVEHQLDDSSEDISTNPTVIPSFADVAASQLSRRRLLQGSLALAATSFLRRLQSMQAGGVSLLPRARTKVRY